MARYHKELHTIRREAAQLAREAANQREADGDPEGAGVIRDLAASIDKIRLTEDYRDAEVDQG